MDESGSREIDISGIPVPLGSIANNTLKEELSSSINKGRMCHRVCSYCMMNRG